MKQQNRSFKGVWIPRELYLQEDLNLTEKILLVEIDSLDRGDGCFASNDYLGKFLGISAVQTSHILTRLRKLGYIIDRKFDGRKRWISVTVKSGLPKTTRQTSGKQAHIPISNTNEKDSFLKGKESSPITEGGIDEIEYVSNIDESGDEITTGAFGRPLNPGPKIKREGKNKLAMRIQGKFIELARKETDTAPIRNTAGYLLVLRALNMGGLTEDQIYELFDDWFSSGRADEELIQITRCLSDIQVNNWKVENQIK